MANKNTKSNTKSNTAKAKRTRRNDTLRVQEHYIKDVLANSNRIFKRPAKTVASDIKELKDRSMKVGIYTTDDIMQKFAHDCVSRHVSPTRRFSELFVERYKTEIMEMGDWALARSGDNLKRGGLTGKTVDAGKRKTHTMLNFESPVYGIMFKKLKKVAMQSNMLLGAFCSLLIEDHYRDYKFRATIDDNEIKEASQNLKEYAKVPEVMGKMLSQCRVKSDVPPARIVHVPSDVRNKRLARRAEKIGNRLNNGLQKLFATAQKTPQKLLPNNTNMSRKSLINATLSASVVEQIQQAL